MDAVFRSDAHVLLERCGRWCLAYAALHNRITAQRESASARILEVDCETYSCGGLGNILVVLGQWAMLAYATDRALVYRLPASYRFDAWLESPFFDRITPPERAFPYTFAGSFIQTLVMRRGDDLDQVQRRLATFRTDSPHTILRAPLVVVRPNTVSIAPALEKNTFVLHKLKRDGFPRANFSRRDPVISPIFSWRCSFSQLPHYGPG